MASESTLPTIIED
jgi:hypothetical protein